MRFIFGPILIIIGVLMMKYTVQITNVTGTISWAEKYLRTGMAGTYTWWRLFGLGLIILSLAWMFGLTKISPTEVVPNVPADQPSSYRQLYINPKT